MVNRVNPRPQHQCPPPGSAFLGASRPIQLPCDPLRAAGPGTLKEQ